MMLRKETFEWMDTAMSEVADWLNYEADMETNPYGDTDPTDADLCEMEREAE